MNWQTILYNGVLTFLTTFATAALAILMDVQAEGGGLSDISNIQLVIISVGAFIAATAQRRGYQAPPPVK